MSRTGVFLLLILGAALVVETAYQLATGGFIGSEAGRYPSAQAFAREAGLAPRPAPPRAAVAEPPIAPSPPGAPAPAADAQPVRAAIKPAASKARPAHRPHPRADVDHAPPSETPAPPAASPPQAPIVAPY